MDSLLSVNVPVLWDADAGRYRISVAFFTPRRPAPDPPPLPPPPSLFLSIGGAQNPPPRPVHEEAKPVARPSRPVPPPRPSPAVSVVPVVPAIVLPHEAEEKKIVRPPRSAPAPPGRPAPARPVAAPSRPAPAPGLRPVPGPKPVAPGGIPAMVLSDSQPAPGNVGQSGGRDPRRRSWGPEDLRKALEAEQVPIASKRSGPPSPIMSSQRGGGGGLQVPTMLPVRARTPPLRAPSPALDMAAGSRRSLPNLKATPGDQVISVIRLSPAQIQALADEDKQLKGLQWDCAQEESRLDQLRRAEPRLRNAKERKANQQEVVHFTEKVKNLKLQSGQLQRRSLRHLFVVLRAQSELFAETEAMHFSIVCQTKRFGVEPVEWSPLEWHTPRSTIASDLRGPSVARLEKKAYVYEWWTYPELFSGTVDMKGKLDLTCVSYAIVDKPCSGVKYKVNVGVDGSILMSCVELGEPPLQDDKQKVRFVMGGGFELHQRCGFAVPVLPDRTQKSELAGSARLPLRLKGDLFTDVQSRRQYAFWRRRQDVIVQRFKNALKDRTGEIVISVTDSDIWRDVEGIMQR